ncbi:alcohol dehydrogenase [Bryobacterales bacterium F-183]|nr:alcohol dehydrogenase [Bryobacterales bacterium F-183]
MATTARKKTVNVLTWTGFCFLFIVSLPAADWPQFLGPARNGTYDGILKGRTPALQWKSPVGAGFAGPVVSQGRLILFHRTADRETIEALDSQSGKKVWSFAYPTAYRDDFGFDEGPRATPVVSGGKVYTHGAEGMLTCVDFATGKKIWQLDTRGKFGFAKQFFGMAAIPLIEGNTLILNIGGSAGIAGINKDTGAVLWTSTKDEAGYSSPVAATIGNERHVFAFTRAGLNDLNPADGKVRFTIPFRSRNDASVNAAVPLIAGDLVFVSASYRTGAMALQVTGSTYKKLWANDESMSNHYATSVLKDGYLYGFHGRQEYGPSFRCVELKTGKVMWDVPDFGAGTVTLVGNDLMIIKEGGELQWAAADPKTFKSGSTHPLLPKTIRAYPALAGNQLCIRNEQTLSCFLLQ